MAEFGGIHPSDGLSVSVGIYQSVLAQLQFGVAFDDVVEYFLHEVTILVGGLFETEADGILLHCPNSPQWNVWIVDLVDDLVDFVVLHVVAQSLDTTCHDLVVLGLVTNDECRTGHSDELVTCTNLEPRIAGDDVVLAVALDDVAGG